MAYTAPSYDSVSFNFTDSGYTAPNYDAVVLEFGAGEILQYTLFLAINF